MTNTTFSPLREALRSLTGSEPGEILNGIVNEHQLDQESRERLLEWASDHTNQSFLTGAALLDQAAAIVAIYFPQAKDVQSSRGFVPVVLGDRPTRLLRSGGNRQSYSTPEE